MWGPPISGVGLAAAARAAVGSGAPGLPPIPGGLGPPGLGAGLGPLQVAAAEFANDRLAKRAIIGVFFQEPVGFWDPPGFTADGSDAPFQRLRSVELKHGRIAMLATMGYLTPDLTGKFPGFLSVSAGLKFADVPSGLAAISLVPALGWAQVVAYCGFVDLSAGSDDRKTSTPGDFGFKVLTSSDPAVMKEELFAEFANGRLAMMATIGMFFLDGLTGSSWGDWALYTASPLRAFGNELGVQEPVGFWDPLGFTADGSVAFLKRRRSVELKHGRIAKLATMGYLTPDLTGKFPGFLSVSAGLKFADVPNGLAAISKVPALGWARVVDCCGFVEISAGSDDWKIGTPGGFGFKVLTSSDPAEKMEELSAEITSGRLAMMAIIGLFFQDGLTGSAWGGVSSGSAGCPPPDGGGLFRTRARRLSGPSSA